MNIDNNLIARLEEMCMISLTPEEKIHAKKDIEEIIKYFDTLSELDFDDADDEIVSLENRFRNDIPCHNFCAEDILSGAINTKDGMFVVDDTLKGGDGNENI